MYRNPKTFAWGWAASGSILLGLSVSAAPFPLAVLFFILTVLSLVGWGYTLKV